MTSSPVVLELQKKLMDLETQAKGVRSEVKHLQSTQRALVLAENSAAATAEAHAATSTEVSENNSRSLTVQGKKKRQSLPITQDFIDEVTRRAGEVTEVIKAHRVLLREKEDLLASLEHAEVFAQEEEQQCIHIMELAGVDESSPKEMSTAVQRYNQHIAETKETQQLYSERELLRGQLDYQGDEIRRISELIGDTVNIDTQKMEAQSVLAEKTTRLQELRAERERLERAVSAKDKILERKDNGPTEEATIRSADFDRRVATMDVDRERQLIQQNDLTIRHLATQIAKAEKRLELIGDAVSGDSTTPPTEDDYVDVDLLESLISELQALYHVSGEANVRMDFLDAEVELMEYRCGALQQTIRSTRKEMSRIEQDHERYLAVLKKNITDERLATERDITMVEHDIATLRNTPATTRKSSRRTQKTSVMSR